MKIVTIIGARPQFVKAAAVSQIIAQQNHITEIIIHTGQHFDKNMSEIFFEEMKIPKPDYNLNINGLSHAAMTGQMMEKIERILIKEKPDWVLLYGDTNSTIAGALAAKKLYIKVAHVEAGLRSFNMRMPEEINRILTDRISDILFCPTDKAIENLRNEGYDNINCQIVKSGDVMHDAAIYYSQFAKAPKIELPSKFVLTTIHRAENTDEPERMKSIFDALNEIAKEMSVILPLHPRTKKILESLNVKKEKIVIIDPVGYLEMIYLLQKASIIMTDSGGMQKEAFFFKKLCITLRDETEWIELVQLGFNKIVGADKKQILDAYKNQKYDLNYDLNLYGNGEASRIIVEFLSNYKKNIDENFSN